MDLEPGKCWDTSKKGSWKTILLLAYQSLGVVYGDLSISPLYVFTSTFAEDIQHSETNEEIFGTLSFVFWTLTLVPLFKYVFIVLRADDNGEGGTFALYSLICRHAKVSLLPNRQHADEALSAYKMEEPPEKNASKVKMMLEKHKTLHTSLLIVVLLGTCMVIGDGVLTPAISGKNLLHKTLHTSLLIVVLTPTSLKDEMWKGLISNLEPGDEVEVVIVLGHRFTVKKTIAHLIYDELANEKVMECSSVPDNIQI